MRGYPWNFAVLCGLFAAVCAQGSDRAAPEFELRDSRGRFHRLGDLRGNVVLVHFWASWCRPCLPELPEIIGLARELGGKHFTVAMISVDDSWAEVIRALPEKGLPDRFISLLDENKTVAASYGSHQFPETYVIGPNLTIVARLVGPQNWRSMLLRDSLRRLIPSP